MKLVVFSLIFSVIGVFSSTAQAEEILTTQSAVPSSVTAPTTTTFNGSFRTYVASSLNPENSAPSLSFEPYGALSLPSKTVLTLVTNLDRPFNKYENFEIPRIRLRAKQGLALTDVVDSAVELTLNGLSIHRWAADGATVRTSLAAVVGKTFFDKSMLVYAKVGPMYQFNSYEQATSGSAQPRYGVSELVAIEFKTGRTIISADLSFSQNYHQSAWKNSFAATQEVAYYFTDNFSAGVGHALLGSFIDESTGRYSSLQLFNDRQSRVSAFMGYEF